MPWEISLAYSVLAPKVRDFRGVMTGRKVIQLLANLACRFGS